MNHLHNGYGCVQMPSGFSAEKRGGMEGIVLWNLTFFFAQLVGLLEERGDV